jgi:hypothetical protein
VLRRVRVSVTDEKYLMLIFIYLATTSMMYFVCTTRKVYPLIQEGANLMLKYLGESITSENMRRGIWTLSSGSSGSRCAPSLESDLCREVFSILCVPTITKATRRITCHGYQPKAREIRGRRVR